MIDVGESVIDSIYTKLDYGTWSPMWGIPTYFHYMLDAVNHTRFEIMEKIEINGYYYSSHLEVKFLIEFTQH